jgi:hypothetical protein
MKSGITHLIINSPYDEPKQHWHYHRETQKFSLKEGRRPAGYVIALESSKSFDDPGRFVPIDLVNQIRPRVEAWRAGGHPGEWVKAVNEHGGFGKWRAGLGLNPADLPVVIQKTAAAG